MGIPSTTVENRAEQLENLAESQENPELRQKTLAKAASTELNNAELLYLFSKGSEANHQPARPVIEPSIVAPGNKESISHELAAATKAQLNGNTAEVNRRLKRAGIAGQNAARGWFDNPQNGWAENSPRTIASKGSDQPGINTGLMRAAITYVVDKEE